MSRRFLGTAVPEPSATGVPSMTTLSAEVTSGMRLATTVATATAGAVTASIRRGSTRVESPSMRGSLNNHVQRAGPQTQS